MAKAEEQEGVWVEALEEEEWAEIGRAQAPGEAVSARAAG